MDLQRQVQAYIEKHQMLLPGDTVVCAVSGGADSLCLLRLFREIARHVRAVHVHHGIRGESADRDTAYVQKICKEWGVPLTVRYVDAPALAKEEHIGLEEAARKLRYQVLFEEAENINKENEADLIDEERKNERSKDHTESAEIRGVKIAVAHNQDDNAETLLMHLCRGAGIGGLAGIAPVKDFKLTLSDHPSESSEGAHFVTRQQDKTIRIIRPLLNTSRAEIESYLRELSIVWCTDETNADTTYTRNAVRNELLPYLTEHMNTRAKEHIAEAAEHLREVSDYLDRQTERVCSDCKTKDGAIDLAVLRKEEALIQTEVLKRAFAETSKHVCNDTDKEVVNHEGKTSCAGGSAFREQKYLELSHLENLRRLISSSDGTVTISLPGGIIAERRYDRLYLRVFRHIEDSGHSLTMEEVQAPYINPLVFEVKDAFLPSYTNRLDYDKINEVLCAENAAITFRKRAAGDRIRIADGRHKTLKKYMIDDKIPECVRDSLYVLTAGSRVLWVPGFYTEPGLMASKDSKRVLELRYVRHGVFCRDTHQN